MVQDTGASPIVSPNPDFRSDDGREEQVGSRQGEKLEEEDPAAKLKNKRMSITDPALVSSWVTSVMGKKWEEQ
jgi:hypothetical protein